MKRAAILIIAIATLVLFGYPSAPSHADSSNSIVVNKSASTGTVTLSGTPVRGGADEGSGGANEGDADGVSGIKGRPREPQGGLSGGVSRVMVSLENWWKLMLWIR